MADFATIVEAPEKKPRSSMTPATIAGSEMRERLIEGGVLRPAPERLSRCDAKPSFMLDHVALERAAAVVFAESGDERTLAARMAQADPRIATRLEELRAKHGVQRSAA